jgi:EmrB/QacA subfamily drug resistance transporter
MGGAILMANSPAILTRNFPARQRGQALGLQATMTYLGLTVGPSLGGWLAHQWSWRSVFYINIPVGLIALWLSYISIPKDTEERQREKFDFTGAFTFMAGLVALLLGLNKGHDWGWTSPAILALLAGAAVLLITFVFLQRRISHPMLDLSLFRQRIFSAAVASATLNYISIYSLIFLMPFYLIQGRGLNTAQAGLLLTAQPLVMALAAPLSGTLSDRIGSRAPATLGMLILAAGLALLSRLGAQTPLGYVAAGLAIAGLGTGIFISPNTSALMGSAPRHRQGIAAGMLATSRSVGMVLGVGLAGAILTSLMHDTSAATLYKAIDAGILAASIAALASSLISATRGKEEKSISPQPNPELH